MAENEVRTIRAKAFYTVSLDSSGETFEIPLPVEIIGGTGEAHLNDPHTLHAIKAGTIIISASADNIPTPPPPPGSYGPFSAPVSAGTKTGTVDVAIVAVQSVVWEEIDNETIDGELVDSELDANPHPEYPGGERVFPGKISPTDSVVHNIVRVRTQIMPSLKGVKVFFSSFDIDDPSSLSQIDPNGANGDDNNGSPKPGTITREDDEGLTNAAGQATALLTLTQVSL